MDALNLSRGINSGYMDVDDINIAYQLDYKPDSDNLVICLHGLACTKDSFSLILNNPGFYQSSILLIDFPGFGDSSTPENFSYSMEEQAVACENLIRRFPYSKYHLAAHSMGGGIALLFEE
jgi:pimeloyl-ACP methyl ester carboxylesterase